MADGQLAWSDSIYYIEHKMDPDKRLPAGRFTYPSPALTDDESLIICFMIAYGGGWANYWRQPGFVYSVQSGAWSPRFHGSNANTGQRFKN